MAPLNPFLSIPCSPSVVATSTGLTSKAENDNKMHDNPFTESQGECGRKKREYVASSCSAMKISRLMSLPKELRLEIWRHVLNDPMTDKLVVCIQRELSHSTSSKRFCNSPYKHSKTPQIKASFEQPPSTPIGVSLLRTSHFIYGEALPVLYHGVIFCVWDIEGFFPLFLENLSSFAKSCIRFVRLVINQLYEKTSSVFYWALTCAQVAKLNESLRHVEVEGNWPIADKNKFFKHAILRPLLKIKAPKIFLSKRACNNGHEDEFQQLLADAAKDLEAKSDLRRALTNADILERRRLGSLKRFNSDHPLHKKQKLQGSTIRDKPVDEQKSPIDDEREISHDLAAIPGIHHFENELLEWDMVSVRSGPSSPRHRPTNIANKDLCVENASTIVVDEKDDSSSDKESDDWELVDKPAPM